MKKIIIDTNFLLIPYQFKVDIFSEIKRICSFNYEMVIIDRTMNELDGISKSKNAKSADRLAARLAVQLLTHNNIKQIKTKSPEKSVDDLIVDEAGKEPKETVVATNDAELKKRVKEKDAPVIVLRQKKHLVLL